MAHRNIWAVNAGNTTLRMQLFQGEMPGPQIKLLRKVAWENRVSAMENVRSAVEGTPDGDAVVVAMARNDDKPFLREIVEPLAPGVEPHFVDAADPLPFKVHYDSGKPGADRLANAMALRTLFPGEAAMAVDFGTATSITVVDDLGDFLGGAILPGVQLQAESLWAATAGHLPLSEVQTVENLLPIGNSTLSAIQTGILSGHAGAIDRLVADMQEAMAADTIRKVATGGWAESLLPHTHCGLIWHENLTLFGLRCFADQ